MADCKYVGLDFCDVSQLYGFNLIFPDTTHHNVRVTAHATIAVCTACHHQRQPLMLSVD